jgi:hypothetical protein
LAGHVTGTDPHEAAHEIDTYERSVKLAPVHLDWSAVDDSTLYVRYARLECARWRRPGTSLPASRLVPAAMF